MVGSATVSISSHPVIVGVLEKAGAGADLVAFLGPGFPIGGLCTLFDDERGNSTGFCLVLLRLFGSLYDGTVRGSEKGFWAGWDMFLIFGIG